MVRFLEIYCDRTKGRFFAKQSGRAERFLCTQLIASIATAIVTALGATSCMGV
jgi:hypothetical protein